MFGIYPDNLIIIENDEPVLPAIIIIDEFKEEIHIPLSYWNIEDYKRNWLASLDEGIRTKKHAALALSMQESGHANFIFVWVVYFVGDDAFVQNDIIFLDECPNFTPEKLNDFIEPRATFNEDGIRVSEWRTDIDSIISFYNSLKG